jgi:hypothetical protein
MMETNANLSHNLPISRETGCNVLQPASEENAAILAFRCNRLQRRAEVPDLENPHG